MTTQQSLLRLLADGQVHSGEELAREMGLSRAAVWKQIRQLEDLQIPVTARPGQGYCLSRPLDFLSADSITTELNDHVRGALDTLDVLWVTESTSRYISQGSAPLPGQLRVCAAEFQSAGRGRRGRQWVAPFGDGICVSLGYSFSQAPPSLACLSLAIGVGLLRALKSCGVEGAQLKWPNDLVIDGRKLAGILVDVQGEADGPLHVIAGIGVNYRVAASTSREIVAAGGLEPAGLVTDGSTATLERNVVTARIVEAVYAVLAEFSRSGFSAFVREWLDADYLAGRHITVATESGSVSGRAAGVAEDGQLKIETDQGMQQLLSGDVTVRTVS